MSVTIGESGFDELESRLVKLIELVADLRPFWPLVIPLYVRWVGKQFESEGEFFGDHWAPLTADYAARKTVDYPGKGILVAEGDLMHAAQTPEREATPLMLTLSVPAFAKPRGPSAGRTIDPAWFQEGTGRMPARPILPLDGELPQEAQTEIGAAAEFYINDAARRLGLTVV